MGIYEFLILLKHKKQTLLSVMFLFLLVAITITFTQPFKYEAKSRLLIVQNFSANTDTYVFTRTNEYLSNVLSKVELTNSFYNEVMNSGFNINKNYFSGEIADQMKLWNKTVKVSASSDTGIINISVFHPDKYQADQIIRAVDETLKNKHGEYHGGGSNIGVNLIDQPSVSDQPTKPDIVMNLSMGVIFGFIIGLAYIYLFPDTKHDLRVIDRSKKTRVVYVEPEEQTSSPKFVAKEHEPRNTYYNRNITQNNFDEFDRPVRQAMGRGEPISNNRAPENQKGVVIENNDIDDIINHGSMSNIFGQSNLG